MQILKNYNNIVNSIQSISKTTSLIVVTKGQLFEKIEIIIKSNHFDFGENRVQEAIVKWKNKIIIYPKLKLHLIGKLQSNKAKDAFELFDYIHTLDNEKLATFFSKMESNSLRKIKYFIQVNIANEAQKNGISINRVDEFIKYCIKDLKLNVIGLMCIPPIKVDPTQYFKKLGEISRSNNLSELSMGMSSDYVCAIKNGATFVRVGSGIFSEN
jgi:pyridoxal phosphate enzyme (YggS family)